MLKPRHSPGAQRQHPMGRLAAHDLLPRPGHHVELVPGHIHREDRRSRIANGQPFPVGRNPFAVGHLDPGRGAIPGEDGVVRPVDLGQIRQLPEVGAKDARGLDSQMLGYISDPGLAKAFPGKHIDAPGPEQRPQAHLHRAGV